MWRRQRCPPASAVIELPECRGHSVGRVCCGGESSFQVTAVLNQQGRPIYYPDRTSGREESRSRLKTPEKNLPKDAIVCRCRLGNRQFEWRRIVQKQLGSLGRFYTKKKKKTGVWAEKVDPNRTPTFTSTDAMVMHTLRRAEAEPFITPDERGRGIRAAVRGLGHLD